MNSGINCTGSLQVSEWRESDVGDRLRTRKTSHAPFFYSEMSETWFQEYSHITYNVQQGELGSLHLIYPEGVVGSVWTHPGD